MPDISTILGVAEANVASIAGVSWGNVASVDGVSVPTGVGTAFFMGHARIALPTSPDSAFVVTITWSDGQNHTPTAVWLELIGASVNATNADGASMCMGAYDGSTNRCAAMWSEHGQASSNDDIYSSDTECIVDIAGGSVNMSAVGVSFGSNTFTLNVTNAPATALFLKVVAFSGTDAVSLETINPSATDLGTVDKTGLGESANIVLCASCFSADPQFDETINGNGGLVIGYYSWDGTTARQAFITKLERDGQATQKGSTAWYDGRVGISGNHNYGSIDQSWELSNIATGYRVKTHQESVINADADLFALAMSLPAGVEAYVGNFATPTAADPTDKVITDPNWRPQGLMLLSSHIDAASNTIEGTSPDSTAICSGSAISASSEFSSCYTVEDGGVTSDTQSRTDTMITSVITDVGTVAIQGNLKSFNATGFTIEQTANVNAQAARCVYITFQEN